MSNHSQSYNESSIRVLKGLEPVRERPGMYTRTDNPLHIVQELIDNAADEALAGFAKKINVVLHADQSVTVEDNGRGIPTGQHPEEGVPVAEIVFTRLHAGGKFDKKADGAYAFAGGLHGVGVSVTNALSTRLELEIQRDGQRFAMVFARGGEVDQALHVVGNSQTKRATGTKVHVWPDAKYFDTAQIPVHELIHLLRSKAVLLPGLEVNLWLEKNNQKYTWCYVDGLKGYLSETLDSDVLLTSIFDAQEYITDNDENFAKGEGAQWAVAWTQEGQITRESYVNLIPTTAGGTHESGLREGLFQAVKNFIDMHGLMPKGVRLLSDDVFSRVSFVLSAKILDPQFQGQTKEKLNSRDAVRLISTFVRSQCELWLNAHVEQSKKLAEFVIKQAQARTRSAQKVEKRKSSGVAVLPGKLTDCESRDHTRTEIFLVEGDSAGGSAKMGRDKEFQAILPLRGKVLNSWEVEKDRLFANNEIHDISVAIGVDPHGMNESVDLSGIRYRRICILSDADVDGSHIQVLLLTLFYQHFPQLIQNGFIYVARPPLFRLDVSAQGKRPARKIYCLDQNELDKALEKLRKEGVKDTACSVSRFKGLGEMNAAQLWETTLNPDTRRLATVSLGDMDHAQTQAMFSMLMAKSESQQRRSWLEEKGNLAQVDL